MLGRVTLIKVTKDGKEIRANISDEQSIRKKAALALEKAFSKLKGGTNLGPKRQRLTNLRDFSTYSAFLGNI
jgi:hypothetical protein